MEKLIKSIIGVVISIIFFLLVILLLQYKLLGTSEYFVLKKALVISLVSAVLAWGIIKRIIRYFSQMSYLRSPISKVDKMTGEEFELYLKAFFEKNGYRVTTTPISNDYGADLICQKKDEIIAVQAKRYEANVGTAAVQEVVAAREYYDASSCIVITNSYFTKNAKSLAKANGVTLWDRDIVLKMGRVNIESLSRYEDEDNDIEISEDDSSDDDGNEL